MSSATQVTLDELITLQVLARQISLRQKKRVSTNMSGEYKSAVRGRGIDFDEVRAYQIGDDVRCMDWLFWGCYF